LKRNNERREPRTPRIDGVQADGKMKEKPSGEILLDVIP
jgi:hypothetical protein